jgi:hypothetical protein
VFLFDIQQARPQLLELTAGDAHRCTVKGREAVEEAYPWDRSNALGKRKCLCL